MDLKHYKFSGTSQIAAGQHCTGQPTEDVQSISAFGDHKKSAIGRVDRKLVVT